jgi:hypothetical protein
MHAPQLFTRPPEEDPAQLDAGIAAMRHLGKRLEAAKPDAVIIFGSDDHLSSLFGGIQPEVVCKVVADAHDDGLIQRLLPIVLLETATIGQDRPQLPVVDAYENLVCGLHWLRPPTIQGHGNLAGILPTELRFDDAAQRTRWSTWSAR